MPQLPNRQSIRLPNYDYAAPGEYFITICTEEEACLFGYVENGKMHCNRFGHIIERVWAETPLVRPELVLGPFIIMPNHIHFIVEIKSSNPVESVLANSPINLSRKPRSIASFIAGFKRVCTVEVNKLAGHKSDVWQRNYYEHIIRNSEDYARIAEYIQTNPSRWDEDRFNPNKKT